MKLGIVGTNFISDQLVEAAQSIEVEVYAVYSRAENTGEAFANKHGIGRMLTDYDAFLGCGCDAVYIATPNCLHAGQSIRALQAGLHVLCEKPIATRRAEFDRMREQARSAGRVLMEAMRPIHDPAFEMIRAVLPDLGQLRRIDLEFCQYSRRYDAFLAGTVQNAFNPALGNAALMDIGVYPLQILVALFGLPEKCSSASTFLSNGFEGQGSVQLQYPGFLAAVSYAKIIDSVCPSVFTGERGSLTVDRLNAPTHLTLCMRGETPRELDYRPEKNNMVFELQTFRELCERGEINHRFLQISEDTVTLSDRIRRMSKIRFR